MVVFGNVSVQTHTYGVDSVKYVHNEVITIKLLDQK